MRRRVYPLEFAKLLGDEEERRTLQQMLVMMKEPLKETDVICVETAQMAMNERREKTEQMIQEAIKNVEESGKRRTNLGETSPVITSTGEMEVVEALRRQFAIARGKGVKRGSLSVDEANEWKAIIDSFVSLSVFDEQFV